MESLSFFLWLFSIFFLFIVVYWYVTIPPNLPPGPLGLPIIGALLHLREEAHVSFIEMGKKFGNIFHLYLGSTLIVVLNDYEAIKEAFIRQADAFSGRVDDPTFSDINDDNLGIIFTDGRYWREHRRFILSNLRNNGVGKLTLEPLLMNEIQCFVAEMKRHSGRPHDVKHLLPTSLANNINLLITGQRYEYGHPMMEEFLEVSLRNTNTLKPVNIGIIFPWSKKIPGIHLLSNLRQNQLNNTKILSTVKQMIFKMKFDDDKSNDTYAQAYVTERNDRLKKNPDEDIFTDIGLYHNSRDLFAAGTDTSATTLLWVMLYMTHYPNIQRKVQNEIDQAIGRSREPSYADRVMTPYTEATIMEVLRMSSLVPLAVPHRTTRHANILGYRVPKDTLVLANTFAVHYDKQIWGDPDNFRPERFIGEDGKVTKAEHLLPFSIGKRACAGEPLARMELYLYFATMMQHLSFVPAEGVDQSLKAWPYILRRSLCSTVCAKLRG